MVKIAKNPKNSPTLDAGVESATKDRDADWDEPSPSPAIIETIQNIVLVWARHAPKTVKIQIQRVMRIVFLDPILSTQNPEMKAPRKALS